MLYFSKVLLALTGAIFERRNNEMTNTMMSYVHLHKELEEEQVREEFTKENDFTRSKKNWQEKH